MSVQGEPVAERSCEARNARDLTRPRRSPRATRSIWIGGRAVAVAMAAAVSIGMLVMMTGVAGAEPIKFDHYLCYPATGHNTQSPPPLLLADQFDELEHKPEQVQPRPVDRLCAPVLEKNGVKVLFDPVIHLSRYPFGPQPKSHVVRVVNQFEEATITTTAAGALLVPTSKSRQAPPPAPPSGTEYSYEHYKCYTLSTKPKFKPRSVTVVDQFGRHILKVTKRLWLCNPVTKFIPGGKEFPIRNRERHLVCYLAKPKKETLPSVLTSNQFFSDQLALNRAVELCLPSLKTLIR
jgi:hypothetical protein